MKKKKGGIKKETNIIAKSPAPKKPKNSTERPVYPAAPINPTKYC